MIGTVMFVWCVIAIAKATQMYKMDGWEVD